MNKTIEKFLEFNGKVIYFLGKEGQWWIAIKPICEALGVEYTRQFKNIKKDKILAPALAVQPMQVGQDQVRNYACLPEFFVYGWLFKIKSDSKELEEYQWQCYQLLYNHFHGIIGGRKDIFATKAKVLVEKEQLLNELANNAAFARLRELEKIEKKANAGLKAFDKDLLVEQLFLFREG